MPSINWPQVLAAPRATLKILTLGTWKSLAVILGWPFSSSPLSLRNALVRVWLGTTFVTNPSILYSEPSSHTAQPVEGPGFTAYVIPNTEPSKLSEDDAVIVFAHGGGMMIGHPLQYLKSYRRWAGKARKMGKNVAFLALKYPLSTAQKWPAQRNTLLSAYRWLLSHSVSPSKIVFAGDSAGCDLIYLTLIHMRDHDHSLPPPSCVISMSPWLDWTGSETIGHPNWHSDFMFYYDASCPVLNNSLRPEGLPFDTPEISALLAKDLARLPPQLIFYSKDEILASDSSRWIKRSRVSGVDVTEFAVNGEMHTFAVGSPVCGWKMQEDCDKMLLNYIFSHVAKN